MASGDTAAAVQLLAAAAQSGRHRVDDGDTLNGMFKQLLDPAEFRRVVYAGVDAAPSMPSSLQELVADPRFKSQVTALVPAAKQRASNVLHAVKTKGAAQGDVMDSATEAALWPSVFKEAFARELVSMVKAVGRDAHAAAAKNTAMLASPSAPMALWRQLADVDLSGLANPERGWAVAPSFVSSAWAALYLADAQRAAATGRITAQAPPLDAAGKPGPPVESIAWLEPRECSVEYPALAELTERLFALPFELNRMRPGLGLCQALNASTLLRHHPVGTRTNPRLDSGPVGSSTDTGYKLTATLFLNPEWHRDHGGTAHVASASAERAGAEVAPTAGTLLLHRSRSVRNWVAPVTAGSGLFSVTFFLHGGHDDGWVS